MASPEWLHRQSSSHGCKSRGHLQNVVYKFYDTPESFLRRGVSGADSKRTHPAYGQIRGSKPAGRDARHDFLKEGCRGDGAEYCSGGNTRRDPGRSLLPGLARVDGASCNACRSRNLTVTPRPALVQRERSVDCCALTVVRTVGLVTLIV